MELTIRHFIPGRVRLHIPSLCRRRNLAEASLAWLRGRAGIKAARINYDCACAIIEYDVAFERVLRAIIGRLRLMTIDELKRLVVTEDDGNGTSEEFGSQNFDRTHFPWVRVPLALPTLSVALTFSANPIVTAINFP